MPGKAKALLTIMGHIVTDQAVVGGAQVEVKSVGKNPGGAAVTVLPAAVPGVTLEALVLQLLLVGALMIADVRALPRIMAGEGAIEAGAAVTVAEIGNTTAMAASAIITIVDA